MSESIERLIGPPLNFVFFHWLPCIAAVVAVTLVVVFLVARPPRRRWLLTLLGAELLPPVLTTVYLLFTRWPARVFTGASDLTALVFCLAVGVVCVALCPLRAWSRVLVGVIYVPAMGLFVMGYSLLFVCSVFRDCL